MELSKRRPQFYIRLDRSVVHPEMSQLAPPLERTDSVLERMTYDEKLKVAAAFMNDCRQLEELWAMVVERQE